MDLLRLPQGTTLQAALEHTFKKAAQGIAKKNAGPATICIDVHHVGSIQKICYGKEHGRPLSPRPRLVEVAWNSKPFRPHRSVRSVEPEHMESAWNLYMKTKHCVFVRKKKDTTRHYALSKVSIRSSFALRQTSQLHMVNGLKHPKHRDQPNQRSPKQRIRQMHFDRNKAGKILEKAKAKTQKM